jgi:hypothetical protein
MNDVNVDPWHDFVPIGHTDTRANIYANRAKAIAEEVRRGVDAEDGREEPEQIERRRVAQSRAAETPVPTVNMYGMPLRVDHPYVQAAAQSNPALQQIVQQQNVRNMQMLERDYGDVFRNNTSARLAGIHVQDIRQADMARGIVRGDGEVFREAAEATRKVMRGRKGR